MAYITKEQAATFRKALKIAHPEIKFSVRIDNHSSLDVKILEAPYNFFRNEDAERLEKYGYNGINHYHFSRDKNINHKDVIQSIIQICNEGNHDKSDIQSDYFDVGWFFSLKVGSYEKPFVYTGKEA